MITKDDVQHVVGKELVDPEGDKIGSIDTIYLDDDTDEPEFALVNTGLLGMRSSFVPLREARIESDAVRVPYTKDQVKDAPSIDADDRIDESQESELFRYYGMQMDSGRTDHGDPRRETRDRGMGRDTGGTTTDDAMTRSEEELHVGTERRPAGKARLRKHVVTEHVTKTVPVQREEVHIEREPITDENVGDATDGPAISEDEHEVTLMEEQPVVDKEVVPKERVRLDKETVSEQRQVEDDVRREEIDVEGDDQRRR